MNVAIKAANALLAFSFLFTGFVIFEAYTGCHRASAESRLATRAQLFGGCTATVLGTEIKVPLRW